MPGNNNSNNHSQLHDNPLYHAAVIANDINKLQQLLNDDPTSLVYNDDCFHAILIAAINNSATPIIKIILSSVNFENVARLIPLMDLLIVKLESHINHNANFGDIFDTLIIFLECDSIPVHARQKVIEKLLNLNILGLLLSNTYKNSMEHFQYIIKRIAPLDDKTAAEVQAEQKSELIMRVISLLEYAFQQENHIAIEMIFLHYPGIYSYKEPDGKRPIEYAIDNYLQNDVENNADERIDQLVRFLLSTKLGQEAYIYSLAYLISEGKNEIAMRLALAEPILVNKTAGNNLSELNIRPQVLQLGAQYELPEIAAWTWGNDEVNSNVNFSSALEKSFYFSLYTQDWCYFETAFKAESKINPNIQFATAHIIYKYLPDINEPAITALNKLQEEHNLGLNGSMVLEAVAYKCIDSNKPDEATKIFKLNVILYTSFLYILIRREDFKHFIQYIKRGLPTSYIDLKTGDAILHLLVKLYQDLAEESNSEKLSLIKSSLETYLQYGDCSDITQKNKEGLTPLDLISNGNLFDLILQARKPTITNTAAYAHWQHILYNLVVKGDFKSAEVLLAAGVPPIYIDGEGNTALHKAVVVNGVKDIQIRMLLSYYPNVFHRNQQGFKAADLEKNRHTRWQQVLGAASPIQTLLQKTQSKSKPYANFLRNDKADNHLHADNGNALHGAVRANNPALVLELLALKVDPTFQDKNGWSPIRLAVQLGHWDCISVLIPKKLVTEHDKHIYGEVLSWAIRGKQLVLADFLIRMGADVNWHPEEGELFIPILHSAIASQHEGLINLLLMHTSVDLLAEDPAGQTAYDFAKSLKVESDTWPAIIDKLNPELASITHQPKQKAGQQASFTEFDGSFFSSDLGDQELKDFSADAIVRTQFLDKRSKR